MKRVATTAIIRVGGAALQFAFALAISRVLGANAAGVFFFGYSIVLILAVLSRLGTELSGMRVIAAARERRSRTELRAAFETRLRLTVLMSVLFGVLLCAAAIPLTAARAADPDARLVLLVLAAGLPAMALSGLLAEALKAVERSNWGVMVQNVMVPGGATLILILAFALGQGVGPVFVAVSVTMVAWASLGIAFAVWRGWIMHWEARIATDPPPVHEAAMPFGGIGPLLREAPVLLVVSTTSIAMQWMGSVILGLTSNPETVAGYSVSIRLAIVVSTINSAVASVMAPRMASAHARGDRDQLQRHAQQMSALVTAATFPILAVLFVFSGGWLSVFGQDYAAYASALQILITGQVVAALIGHSGIVLVMAGEYRRARMTSVIALAVLLVAMPSFALLYGVNGAAAAMSLAVAAGHVAGMWLVRRHLGFWTLPLSRADLRGFAALRRS